MKYLIWIRYCKTRS